MALVVVGDKIGIDAPTVGGSTDVWGSEQNTNTYPEIDELVYAPREDRNLVVLGGGKISWDSATNLVAFTANITIYNHITASTVSITTAGSPVTLDTALKVGYVKINRKPSSNQSITSVSVAAAGSLPNTNSDADSGVIALFHRTSDSTLMIPWARREILSGDNWQFGASLSWYERIATSSRPSFKSNSADSSQLIVPASAGSPSAVVIDGKIYANVANATMDLDTAGRNGLDTGAKAANTIYYLYAIPPTSGRTFDVVCSVTPPTTGPTGFSSWSYLGAFGTVVSSAIPGTSSSDGRLLATFNTTSYEVTFNSSTFGSKTVVGPTTMKSLFVRSTWSAVNTTGDDLTISSLNDAATTISRHTVTDVTVGKNTPVHWQVEIVTANTIYGKVTTTTSDANIVRTLGWTENLMEFR